MDFRKQLWHFFLVGPLAGALVGAVDTAVALAFWLGSGQPDFYFRGWNGVQVAFMLNTAGGGVVGVAFGLCLLAVETLRRRVVCTVWLLPLLLLAAAAVSGVCTHIAFQRRTVSLQATLLPEAIIVILGFALALFVSRKRQAQTE